MIRTQKLLIISVVLLISFLASTNYLFIVLSEVQSEVKSIPDKINAILKELPNVYSVAEPFDADAFETFLEHLKENDVTSVSKLWKVANSWVTKDRLVDHRSPSLGSLLSALKTSKIIKADLDTRGTQLKLLLTLEGFQHVVFKPKWYELDTVIQGPVYAGKDRYNSEVIAFYISVILNMPFVPCSIERVISFTHELMPMATKRLIDTSYEIGNRTCVYGNCFYCRRQDAVCEDRNLTINGAIIFNINASFQSYKSPWQRTYKKNKQASWEEDDDYCRYVKKKIPKRRLLDLIDTSIFDFLIQNGDRHHYETLGDSVVFLDNGKGFGNPYVNHLDILAPLYQCCMLRGTTLKKLLNLAGGNLRKKLESIPYIASLLPAVHLEALENRLLIVFATIEYCKMSGNKLTF